MTDEFKKKIIDALKKGGFPTELKVGKILDNRDWFNINNYIYFDNDKKISREIDFLCVKHSLSNDYFNVKFDVHLIIEVKKSEKPWAFFIQNFKYDEIDHDKFSSVVYKNINHIIWDNLYTGFPTQKIDFISSSYAEVFRDTEISNIYKAIESVTKATYHFRITNEIDRDRDRDKAENSFADDLFEDIDKSQPSAINVFIPIVVLEGLIVKAKLNPHSDLEIEETLFVPFISYFMSEYNVERSIIINFLTLEYLDKFLENIEKWIENKATEIMNIRNAK